MTVDAQVQALHDRLREVAFDLLFVNGAIARGNLPIDEVPREMFVEVMVTNAYSPMRLLEAFPDLVPPTGHVRTELGGPGAMRTVEQSIPGVVDTITADAGEPSLQFLDRHDEVVPW